MKVINISGDNVSVADANFFSWGLGSIVNPLMIKPQSGSQAMFSMFFYLIIGMLLGGTVASAFVKKATSGWR